MENTPISVNSAEFLKTMREVGRNGVISLDIEGKKLNVLLHEYQEDSLRREVIHADFLAVDMTVEIQSKCTCRAFGGFHRREKRWRTSAFTS